MGHKLKLTALTLVLALAGCGGDRPDQGKSAARKAPAQQIISTQSIPAAMQGQLAKNLFAARRRGSEQEPLPFGSYSKGCMAGGIELPETGPTWQAMRLSRNRNWAQPDMIDFIEKLSRFAATQPGWNGLYVGDISQPRGGPMPADHRSHQLGLDADIWMLPADNLNLTAAQREKISSVSLRRAKGAYTNDNWTRAHFEIIKAAAKDPRTARMFIFPGAKVRMCNEEKGDRSWLRKVRPWWGHYAHIHVRLKCPDGAAGCVNQPPPPPGDGCAEAQEWVDNILNPPPPDPNAPKPKKRRELTMADLPRQCVGVLQAN